MGVPYEMAPMANIQVAADPVVVELAWPDRSTISKIIVVQTDGVKANFSVGLYNHSQVKDGTATSDSAQPDVGKIPNDCYRVTHEIPCDSAGQLVYFSDHETGGYGFVFKNMEHNSDRQGQARSKLYLMITPTTAGAKSFAVAIGGVKEVE